MEQNEQKNRYITNLNQEAIDFLLYSYFGIDNSKSEKEEVDLEQYVKMQCAQRAYLDLNRTLKFSEKLKGKNCKEAKKGELCIRQFRNILCEVIVSQIDSRILGNCKNFDDEHEKICKLIKKLANNLLFKIPSENIECKILEEGSFKDGQAQKWVNMTLKYMWLLGKWKKLDDLNLHVPVDRYILQAVSERFEKVPIPRKDKKISYKYSESYSEPWSAWEYPDYISFQERLGNNRKEWEGREWIRVAEKRKKAEKESFKNVYEITLYENAGIKGEIVKMIEDMQRK